jgi:hypothetical protein
MDDLARAARRRSLDQAVRENERIKRAFGPAAAREGRALIQRHIDRLTDFIRTKRARRPTRQTKLMESLTPEVFALMQDVPHDEVAQAALYGTINTLRAPPDEDDDDLPGGLGRRAKESIGAELERACRAHYLRSFHKTLAADIRGATAYKPTIKERLAIEHKILRGHQSRPNTRRINWLKWSKSDRIDVGNWAFDACLEALPDLIVVRMEGKDRVPDISEGVWDTATAIMCSGPSTTRPILLRSRSRNGGSGSLTKIVSHSCAIAETNRRSRKQWRNTRSDGTWML